MVAGNAQKEEKELGLLGNNGTAISTLIALMRLEPAEASAPLAMPLWKRCQTAFVALFDIVLAFV